MMFLSLFIIFIWLLVVASTLSILNLQCIMDIFTIHIPLHRVCTGCVRLYTGSENNIPSPKFNCLQATLASLWSQLSWHTGL